MSLLLLSAVFAAAAALAVLVPFARPPLDVTQEQFTPELFPVSSVDEALESLRLPSRSPENDLKIVKAIDSFVVGRFAHGYSAYRPAEDWLAYLAGFV